MTEGMRDKVNVKWSELFALGGYIHTQSSVTHTFQNCNEHNLVQLLNTYFCNIYVVKSAVLVILSVTFPDNLVYFMLNVLSTLIWTQSYCVFTRVSRYRIKSHSNTSLSFAPPILQAAREKQDITMTLGLRNLFSLTTRFSYHCSQIIIKII